MNRGTYTIRLSILSSWLLLAPLVFMGLNTVEKNRCVGGWKYYAAFGGVMVFMVLFGVSLIGLLLAGLKKVKRAS
jgi:hypothetical protein